MENLAPSVFGDFNARFASIPNLVEAFIPSEDFGVAASSSHTVILGPRGSGKTYLLKMLQPVALNSWRSTEAEGYKKQIQFLGIYIPTDISWRQQAEQLGKPGLSDEYLDRLQKGVFTAQVLHRIVETLIDASELAIAEPWGEVRLDFDLERELVDILASRWKLKIRTPTLLSLKISLAARTADIWKFGRRETLLPDNDRGRRFAENDELSSDFFDETTFCLKLVGDITKTKGRTWALLFDELEIAPDWLINRLFVLLRSSTQSVYIKLSMSPFAKVHAFEGGLSARPGNDFNVIRLWYMRKTEAKQFSQRLFKETLRKRGVENPDLYKLFGESRLGGNYRSDDPGYAPGSRNQKVLADAFKSDAGFRKYCEQNEIDLNRIHEMPEDQRAAKVRKIFPIVLFRQEFRKSDSSEVGSPKLRSRKKPTIFSGIDSLLDILEGNPRWIVGVANEFVPIIRKFGKVNGSKQYDEMIDIADRFLAILKTIPFFDNGAFNTSIGDILEKAAERIHASVVLMDFSPEPYGSFRVDTDCPDGILEAIGTAINTGAIISTSDDDQSLFVSTDLKGKEFRLTYLLSPYKRIPFRIGRSFPLSSILPSDPKDRPIREKREDRSVDETPTKADLDSNQLEFLP